MVNKILMLIVSCVVVYANSFNIEIKKDSWNLVGTPVDLNLTDLNLSIDDIVWHYKEGDWFINKDISEYAQINSLKANDAFWIYSNSDRNITLNNDENITMLKPLRKYWSMYSPLENITLNTDFNSTNVGIVWTYNDNNWSVWDPANLYQDFNYTTSQDIKVGEGSWVFGKVNFVPKIIKLSSESIENIWNLSFKIDASVDYTNLDIGVKFVKHENDGDDDIGKFIYDDVSITSNSISNPTAIFIQGIGDSGSKTTPYTTSYDPDNILDNSLELHGNILTLKLGYIMKNQTSISESTFKALANYDIIITSNNDTLINNSVAISKSFQIETMSKTINFTNTKGIMVEMQIK